TRGSIRPLGPRHAGDEGWFGSPQRFAFLPPSPACRWGEECPPRARGCVGRTEGGTVIRCPEAADLVGITVQSPHCLRAVRRDRELSRFIMRSRPAPRQQKSHTVHERAPK